MGAKHSKSKKKQNRFSCLNSNISDHSNKKQLVPKQLLFLIGDCFRGTASIEVEESATIAQLKQMIADKCAVPYPTIRIAINNGKPLHHNELTLIDYNITNLSTIYVRTMFSAHKILINLNKKVLYCEDFGQNSTVLNIKQVLEKIYEIPARYQQLYKSKSELQDDFKLTDVGVYAGSELFLKIDNRASYLKRSIINNIVKSIDGTEEEARDISDMFWKTISRKDATILKVLKIEHNLATNSAVFESILSTKKNGNEKMLFHGTTFENIEKIIFNGFDRDCNVKSLYGTGTYFALNASLAKKYCKPNGINGHFVMLVCRVLIGDCTVGYKNMKKSKLFKADQTQYDSLVNNLHYPTIFVINRDYHAIPMYIIEFK